MFSVVLTILEKSGLLLLDLLPYILIGVLLAEVLKYTPFSKAGKKAAGKDSFFKIIAASVLGIISPLSTFATIPVILSLYHGGVALSILLTFLSASSLMNPQLFLVTWGGLGGEFALLRLAAVFLFTLILGVIIIFFEKKNGSFGTDEVHERLKRQTSSVEKNIHNFRIPDFLKSAYFNLEYVGFYVVIGVLASTTLETLVPVSVLLKGEYYSSWLNIILAALISIPVYVCGGGIIPFVDMLMQNGLSTGAAMAFLVTGPGTRIAPLLAMGSFLSKKMLGFYVAVLILFSILLGLFLDGIFTYL